MKLARTRVEMLIWPMLAFLCFVRVANWRPTPLTDDGYQYLNVADNFSHGRGIVTTLVHFDSERSNGRIPAPLTTFAPGYPVAISFVSRFTGSLESAGRILSGLGYAGVVALLTWGLLVLRSSFFVRQIVLLVFVTNAVNLSMATAVLTESTFMFVSTAAILGLIAIERGARRPYVNIALALGSYTLVGISYYIRYAGLFLIMAVLGYTLIQFLLHRNRLRTICLIASMIPLALAGAIMLRNISTVGTWRGGNDMRVDNPLFGVAGNYVRAQAHLMLGQHALRFGIWEKLLLIGALSVATLLIASGRNVTWHRPGNPVLLVILCVGVYSAGIFYAGLRTPISFGTRMFLPMLPLCLLLLGKGLSWLAACSASGWRRMLLTFGMLSGAVGYVGANTRDLYAPETLPEYKLLAREYTDPVAGGSALLDWIQSHVSPADPVFAEDGQATGYLLHRSIVSMVGPRYSPVRWECPTIRSEMQRFGARYLVVYKVPMTSDNLELVASSTFLADAVTHSPDCGFVLAAENSAVRVLELTDVTK